MNVLGTRFRLALPVIMALAAFLIALAAAPNTASAASNPSGLSAEVCGDAVCVSWTKGDRVFDFQSVVAERPGFLDNWEVSHSMDSARISFKELHVQPTYRNGDTVNYSFIVIANKYSDNGRGYAYRESSNRVSVEITRPMAHDARPAPSNLQTQQGWEQVILTWMPGNDPGYDTQFVMRRLDTPGSSWSPIHVFTSDDGGLDAFAYVDNNPEVGSTYQYKICSVDGRDYRCSNTVKVTVKEFSLF